MEKYRNKENILGMEIRTVSCDTILRMFYNIEKIRIHIPKYMFNENHEKEFYSIGTMCPKC